MLALAIACPASALAAGGVIQPSSATTLGYSLIDIAQQSAVYNTGQAAANPATPPPPNIPFQILVGDATVSSSSYLYMPIFFADDGPPIPPAFPSSLSDQAANGAYLAKLVQDTYGITAFIAQVDGITTTLDNTYTVGVTTPPLLDGLPAGTHYIVNAVVLSPLSPGAHTVAYGGIIGGQPTLFGTYAVTVTPEPTTLGVLGAAGLAVVRRRRR